MNTLSNIFDSALQSLGIHVATGCNGHILFAWCMAYAVLGAIYFRRWSWGAFGAAAAIGIIGNLVRVGVLLTLTGLPHFHLFHDILGWFVSGIAILLIVECYEPRRATAVWLGRALCLLLVLWAIALVYVAAFPGSDCRVAYPEACPKNPGNSFEKGITL